MALADVVTGRQLIEGTPTDAQYDKTVREDIELFRSQANSFVSGQITADEFRAFRLRRGIYGQRQAGVQMIRTKIPGGLLTAGQMRQLARVADEFAGGKGHLTTRQNMQYHFVPLANVPDLLHLLADVAPHHARSLLQHRPQRHRLPARPAFIRDEVFESSPYARRMAFAFLHKELTDNLPRKFKIAFSGCPEDCIGTAINDVGLRAVIRDGQRGFRMLSPAAWARCPPKPSCCDEFLPAEDRGPPHGSRHPRLQRARQPQEQEQGAAEIRHARARV